MENVLKTNKKCETVLKTLNIMYIDDNIDFIENLTNIVKNKSKYFYTAMNFAGAVEIYNNHKIDVILLELIIANKNSIEFIKKIRNINVDIPIIIISSCNDANVIKQLIGLKLTAFIAKPIILNLLKEALYSSAYEILLKGLYNVRFNNNTIYNVTKKMLTKDSINIELTTHEILFLDALISNRHQVLSSEMYKELIWHDSYGKTDAALKSLLNRLRKKIGKSSIKTTSGLGYRLVLQDE